jgi:hypothetical protein
VSVTRWNMGVARFSDEIVAVENRDGAWVEHRDYAALEAEIERLTQMEGVQESICNHRGRVIQELDTKVERLTAALRNAMPWHPLIADAVLPKEGGERE